MTATKSSAPPPEHIPPVTAEQVEAFAAASGDRNPVHLSSEAATAAGLAGPVLHGMFIAGRFEAFLERMEGYDISQLKVTFVRPVPVGSSLMIEARPIDASTSSLRLRLLARMDGNVLVAVAEAMLRASCPVG